MSRFHEEVKKRRRHLAHGRTEVRGHRAVVRLHVFEVNPQRTHPGRFVLLSRVGDRWLIGAVTPSEERARRFMDDVKEEGR